MKYYSLFTRITELETLTSAWERVRSKNSAGGLDGVSVSDFNRDATSRIASVRSDLLQRRYTPSPLRQIEIPKAPGKPGARTLRLPTVRDKVVQEAVRSVIQPILESTFLNCSYGYRPGKGPQRAIRRVNHHVRGERLHWSATADIDDFFGSVRHDLLLERLRSRIEDPDVLRLIELWVRIGSVDGRGAWKDVRAGIAQGAIISPLLANLYLHSFDAYMIENRVRLVRYADDFVLLAMSRDDVVDALTLATVFLRDELHLRLNDEPDAVASLEEGFSFLGIHFCGERRAIASTKLDGIASTIRQLTSLPAAGDLGSSMDKLNRFIVAWRQYYGRLLQPAELASLEDSLQQGLIELNKRMFEFGVFRSIRDAMPALENLEPLREIDPKRRRDYLESIAQNAKSLAVSGRKRGKSVEANLRLTKQLHHYRMAEKSALIVSKPGRFIGKSRQFVVVRERKHVIAQVRLRELKSITVATRGVSLSSDVVSCCAERGIPILFVSASERLDAMLSSPFQANGAVGVRQLQAVASGQPAFDLAKEFAAGKIRNQCNLMKYINKYRKTVDSDFARSFETYIARTTILLAALTDLSSSGDLRQDRNRIFSVEGRAGAAYWRLVGQLLRPYTEFPGRSRRGATDRANMLLNYGYAILRSQVHLAIVRAGLMPELSFLHAYQNRRDSLVFDLMEEFRAPVVDRTVFTMFSRKRLLETDADGRLSRTTRGMLIGQIHRRLGTLLQFRGRELTLGEVIESQARSLAAQLEGAATYRPYAFRW